MRRATHNVSWMTDETGQTVGFSLGYDFCAEHEADVPYLKKLLGVSGGLGIEGRTMTKQPDLISFGTYERTRAKKPGTRKAPPTDLAALLIVGGWRGIHEVGTREAVKNLEVDFWVEPYSDIYDDQRDTIASSWSEDGFAIHVRGEENVSRLTELAEHLRQNDIALADPSGMGFANRSGLAVAIASRIPEHTRQKIMSADLAYEKLMKAKDECGIEEELKEAGKRYYALSPAWADEQEAELKFFLNPAQQDKFQAGWYNLDELRQWAKDEGPVLKDEVGNSRKMKP